MDLAPHRKPLRVLASVLGALAAVMVVAAIGLCVQAGWSWRDALEAFVVSNAADGRGVRRLRCDPRLASAAESDRLVVPGRRALSDHGGHGGAVGRRAAPGRRSDRPAATHRDRVRLVLAVGDRPLHPARPAALSRRPTAVSAMAPGGRRGDRDRPAVQPRDGGRPGTDGTGLPAALPDAAVLRRAAAAVAARRAAAAGGDRAGPGRTRRALPPRHRSRPGASCCG